MAAALPLLLVRSGAERVGFSGEERVEVLGGVHGERGGSGSDRGESNANGRVHGGPGV